MVYLAVVEGNGEVLYINRFKTPNEQYWDYLGHHLIRWQPADRLLQHLRLKLRLKNAKALSLQAYVSYLAVTERICTVLCRLIKDGTKMLPRPTFNLTAAWSSALTAVSASEKLKKHWVFEHDSCLCACLPAVLGGSSKWNKNLPWPLSNCAAACWSPLAASSAEIKV